MTPRNIRLLGTALSALVLIPLALAPAAQAQHRLHEEGRTNSRQDPDRSERFRRDDLQRRETRHGSVEEVRRERREERRDFRRERQDDGRDVRRDRRDDVRDRRWDRRDTDQDRRRDIAQPQHRDPRWDRDRRDGRWDRRDHRDPQWDRDRRNGHRDRDRRDRDRWDRDHRWDRDDRWDRDRRWDNRHDRRRWEYARRRHDFYHDRARREAQLRWIHHMNSGWSSSRYYGHWGPSDRWCYHRTYYNHGYERRRFAYYDGLCRYDRNGEGAVVGALLGALIGGAAANDDDVGAGILVGAGFGAVLGSSLSGFDNCDRAQYHYAMNHAFEYGQPYYWANPYSGVRGTVVVRETYYVQGVECRWGDAEIYMPDGTYNYDRVRMCRDAYGDWQVAGRQ